MYDVNGFLILPHPSVSFYVSLSIYISYSLSLAISPILLYIFLYLCLVFYLLSFVSYSFYLYTYIYSEFSLSLIFSLRLYRVFQKKRNGGFSVPCELNVLYYFTPLDKASSAEENDTKIIKFG